MLKIKNSAYIFNDGCGLPFVSNKCTSATVITRCYLLTAGCRLLRRHDNKLKLLRGAKDPPTSWPTHCVIVHLAELVIIQILYIH